MKKTALITGGARGIGYGIARCLAREGYGLAIDDTRDESEFSTARQELRNLGAEVYCRADISDAADRQRLLEEVRAAYSGLNVLVNNTDVTPLKRADLLEASEESFERLIRIILPGPYFLAQAVARWGETEDVGRAVAALDRGDLGYSTGEVIMVDGGLTVPRL